MPTAGGEMAEQCYRVSRDDGEELGVFDREDEAKQVAEYDASTRGYGIKWLSYFGGFHGKPTTNGRNVFGYRIAAAPCE
jgi:hypothetical protein